MKEATAAARTAAEQSQYNAVAEVIERYKGHKDALIMVLHAAQEIFGYLPAELQRFIAEGMDIPISEVSGVVSFYSYFSTQKRGKHTIRMCQGTACYVRGGKKVVEEIKKELNVDVGGTTADGLFTFSDPDGLFNGYVDRESGGYAMHLSDGARLRFSLTAFPGR